LRCASSGMSASKADRQRKKQQRHNGGRSRVDRKAEITAAPH
jgi:hypothetical protein